MLQPAADFLAVVHRDIVARQQERGTEDRLLHFFNQGPDHSVLRTLNPMKQPVVQQPQHFGCFQDEGNFRASRPSTRYWMLSTIVLPEFERSRQTSVMMMHIHLPAPDMFHAALSPIAASAQQSRGINHQSAVLNDLDSIG
jgi:hypothetical protein